MKRERIVPSEISYHSKSRVLDIRFGEETFELSAEFLRVHSPSAEVRGHGPGQEILQIGKERVGIRQIEPVGNYAVRIYFDDGHHTGIYSWEELHRFATHRDEMWRAYLARLEAAGHRREPGSS